MVRSHHNESPVPETRTLHPERTALALTVAALFVGCGAASTPARYAERPLLTPDDEHTLVVVIPAGFSSNRLLKKQPARARTARRNHRGFEKAE
jgi:hypothetical protein